MGTTIAGNNHVGTNWLSTRRIKTGNSYTTSNVELYEYEGFFVYQFNPLYDMKDDGDFAIEFYFYFKRPESSIFWNYIYKAKDFYIYPIIACYEDNPRGSYWSYGDFVGTIVYDAEKISLVGRDSGWIHVTLHVDEYIWGRYTNNGKTYDNPIYVGIYSPLLNFCWDNSLPDEQTVSPYMMEFDISEFEEDDYGFYDVLTGGYLEDCNVGRTQLDIFPSLYITFKDVTPESAAYTRCAVEDVNVMSLINKSVSFKKFLNDVKLFCETDRKRIFWKRCLISSADVESKRRQYYSAKRFLLNNVNEIDIHLSASRVFFRAVETVINFWDWLRGKIREANNVVTLFCPIADEIILECRI